MKARNGNTGFTLIEIMIVVALFALFLVMAMPSINVYLANTKIRNVAESIAAGMQKARAHAIKSNVNTEFVVNTAAGSWTIWQLNDAVAPATQVAPAIETFVWGAGGHNWTGVTTALVPAGQTTTTFNGLGRLLPQNLTATTAPPTNVTVQGTLAGTRRLQVNVLTAGGVRVCDQDLPTDDLKSCNFAP